MSEFAATTAPRGALAKIDAILRPHLEGARSNPGDAKAMITLGELSDLMEERAFGLLLLVLALPCCLPFVYLLPQLVALPMLVLAAQMASGRKAPWLPETLRKRALPVAGLLDVVARAKRYGGWLERLAHPRFASLTGDRAARLIGALLIIPCASILVPLPLTNTVPGIGVALAAIGLIERDALFVILGLVVAMIWVAILVIGGPALLYFLIDFVFNRGSAA
ncbi:MAG: exopolysaccharide biosynthesis protein [Hoeflea sp.]|uniref:exopolysaccharide biosynthesis protein n=1 Tax=Hoeflea sp. TaxID=1940281 RepID=UPI001DF9A035|nr:exopolysaccharide biosynthesis protein [Hoeflea sp.]MBU4528671.1 exopolysaccharide biosynthesis protein [Alphaproteobacteria bacterium]MBU4545524.1 exopolysaccharide biosynthesis protein [Alphaproteobacteria bacterium]MBU4552134.1 exopolysaccharide biosynthesis protein [Alphaproteobacteria bacterium]MBV1726274.1 exopolysaccharide biosynthesis protein [Hoeflea sp.]MBV1762299.1 exopolysaccharide biosynthesis protein [Hoeflea sp.]